MSESVTDLQSLPTLKGDERENAGFSCTNITVICCVNTVCVNTN
ncbi:MAG TPA: hypothetical protein VGO86_08480 [Candidatus Dormibacteraeota bacterium]